ncbi:SET domain-containing protein 9 isoform X2 [Lagopus muta]|uniref:SET domain-containing protein 9 isoform X2 n=1 Tax=Lagopus muta TaxID=64668 RepID=UPI00209DB339|nr:SET domain-containing protein 9 isoform X2 [Lagopus muta]
MRSKARVPKSNSQRQLLVSVLWTAAAHSYSCRGEAASEDRSRGSRPPAREGRPSPRAAAGGGGGSAAPERQSPAGATVRNPGTEIGSRGRPSCFTRQQRARRCLLVTRIPLRTGHSTPYASRTLRLPALPSRTAPRSSGTRTSRPAPGRAQRADRPAPPPIAAPHANNAALQGAAGRARMWEAWGAAWWCCAACGGVGTPTSTASCPGWPSMSAASAGRFGTVYRKHEPIFFQSLGNPFIFRCIDGILIDGNDKGLSRSVYRSCSWRDQLGPFQMSDVSWLTAAPQNPLAVGQYVNNCSYGHYQQEARSQSQQDLWRKVSQHSSDF